MSDPLQENMPDPLAPLADKIDAFFARVEARHGADMDCATGCADCCHAELTVTALEADRIVRWAETQALDLRRRLASTSELPPPGGPRCAALDANDRCQIYLARPMVCRSHGVPVRLGPGEVTACPRNFTAQGPAAADADCILDQTTLSATLLLVHRHLGAPADRVPLRDVLRSLTTD